MTAQRPGPAVLIVDQEPNHRMLFASTLIEVMPELQLRQADGFDQALATLAADGIDAVISEYGLGPRSGIDLLTAARDTPGNPAFIFVTNLGSEEVAREAFVSGATDYLTKDEAIRNPLILARVLRRALDARSLRQERQRFDTLLENFLEHNPYAVLICDPDGCVVRWNQTLADMEERPGDLTRLQTAFRPLDDRQLEAKGVAALLRKAMQGEWTRVPPFVWEPRRSGFAGRNRVLQGTAFPLQLGDPQPTRHLCLMFRDVTVEERARRERDEYQAILTGLLNALQGAVSFVDTDGKVRFANRYVEEFYGVDPGPFLGRDVEPLLDRIAEATADPATAAAHLRLQHQDPELEVDESAEILRPRRRHIRHRSGPVRAPDGRLLGRINLCLDETESIERQELLEQQNRELDAFASRLAHDFKTPLVSLKGFADLLKRQCATELGEKGGLYLAKVRSSASLLGEMVDGLRDLARAGETTGTDAAVDPLPVLRLVLDNLEDFARNRCVTISLPEHMPAVACERARVYEIFQNLLSNAIRYAEEDADNRWVRVAATTEGSFVAVDIADNGVGIPAEDLPLLFRPFHRGGNAAGRSGMGLGLAITERMVKASGGQIRVESRLGEGTRFTVLLPLGPDPGAA